MAAGNDGAGGGGAGGGGGFGRGSKTVILPNPGGRRPAQAEPAPAPPVEADVWGAPQPSPVAPQRAPARPSQPAPERSSHPAPERSSHPAPERSRQRAPERGPAMPLQSKGPAEPAPPAFDPNTSPIATEALLRSKAALNANEMLRAASPLLMTLSKMRAGLVRAQSAMIMEEVARAIQNFERAMAQAGYSSDQAEVAKYALAATADDVIQNIPVDDRARWTQYSMLSQFFGERTGGIRFYEELRRMRADPSHNIDVLELMYACLAVGFEGVYRTSPSGAVELQQTQRELYDTIRRIRPRESNELSPRWQGSNIKPRDRRNRLPLWVVAACGLGLVVVTFFVLRALLSTQAGEVADEILALYPLTPVTLVRPQYEVPPPPPPEPEPEPPTPQADRVRATLGEDISDDRVLLDTSGGVVKITIGDIPGEVLFLSGSTIVSDEFAPVVERIASTLRDEPGEITVIGHTDSVPIRSRRFPSNYELSVARAQAIADMLADLAIAEERIAVKGKGSDSPIASNETREGQARNRRVDLIIPKVDER